MKTEKRVIYTKNGTITRDYTPNKSYPEKNEGMMITETAGYLPHHLLVRQYMQAGKELLGMRELLYDYPNGDLSDDDGSWLDQTRRKDFDPSEAQAMMTKYGPNVAAAYDRWQRDAQNKMQNDTRQDDTKTRTMNEEAKQA